MLFNFFAIVSHAPLFLLLPTGKLFHISKRNLVSASDQVGQGFSLTGPPVRMFFLVLMEDEGEDDVLQRDVAGVNCRAFGTASSAWCHHEISKVLVQELRELMRPEELLIGTSTY